MMIFQLRIIKEVFVFYYELLFNCPFLFGPLLNASLMITKVEGKTVDRNDARQTKK